MRARDQHSIVEPTTVDGWLASLGLEPLERASRDRVSSWDLLLDGQQRADIRLTVILDPGGTLVLWVHFAPPLNDSFRVSYRQFLLWNDELPFVKFALSEDERPVLTSELSLHGLDADGLGLAITRLLAVCDLTYERSLAWLHPGAKSPPPMTRPSRGAVLFSRFASALPELLGEERPGPDVAVTEADGLSRRADASAAASAEDSGAVD
jgi:hypothetical protein